MHFANGGINFGDKCVTLMFSSKNVTVQVTKQLKNRFEKLFLKIQGGFLGVLIKDKISGSESDGKNE